MQLKSNYKKLILFILFFPSLCFGQLAKFQAVYIYNICRYIEWPTEYRSGTFLIGVIENDQVVTELKSIASSKNMMGQTIEVRVFNSAESIDRCHVLFVPEKATISLTTLATSVKNKCTLIVSHRTDGTNSGAAVNFIFSDNKLKFELKKENATSKGLKISSDLDKLAYKVL